MMHIFLPARTEFEIKEKTQKQILFCPSQRRTGRGGGVISGEEFAPVEKY